MRRRSNSSPAFRSSGYAWHADVAIEGVLIGMLIGVLIGMLIGVLIGMLIGVLIGLEGALMMASLIAY